MFFSYKRFFTTTSVLSSSSTNNGNTKRFYDFSIFDYLSSVFVSNRLSNGTILIYGLISLIATLVYAAHSHYLVAVQILGVGIVFGL